MIQMEKEMKVLVYRERNTGSLEEKKRAEKTFGRLERCLCATIACLMTATIILGVKLANTISSGAQTGTAAGDIMPSEVSVQNGMTENTHTSIFDGTGLKAGKEALTAKASAGIHKSEENGNSEGKIFNALSNIVSEKISLNRDKLKAKESGIKNRDIASSGTLSDKEEREPVITGAALVYLLEDDRIEAASDYIPAMFGFFDDMNFAQTPLFDTFDLADNNVWADGSDETAAETEKAVFENKAEAGEAANSVKAEETGIIKDEIDLSPAEPSYSVPSDVPDSLTYCYNPDMCLALTDEEIENLCILIEAEAEGQDIFGKMLVANVVINRVHDKHFADNVIDVIFERIGGSPQFAPTYDGRFWEVSPAQSTREAVRRVLSGEDYSQGALYFFERARTTSKKASWFDDKLTHLFKYGCHDFYRE